jgi:hypothetical protein
MPLAGLQGKLSFERFLEYIKSYHLETGDEIRIFAYITDLQAERLKSLIERYGFQVKDLGDVFEVKASYSTLESQNSTTFYCRLDKKLLLCFTSDTIDDANRTIDKFVNQQNGIFPLWIHPVAFDNIRRKILNEKPEAMITEFHATRDHYYRFDQKVIREQYNRYFRYSGDDGRETLEEINRSYGVIPNHILFWIPGVCKFRITNQGKFAFIHGDIQYLFRIINDVLATVLKTKKIIDEVKSEYIPVNMGRKEIKLAKVVPLNIKFSREIDYSEMQGVLENMTGDDFNFEIFDMSLIPGSIHLSGTVVDKNKNEGFNITGNARRIALSPRGETTFDSMMHFYKLIVDRLDIKAECSVSTGRK